MLATSMVDTCIFTPEPADVKPEHYLLLLRAGNGCDFLLAGPCYEMRTIPLRHSEGAMRRFPAGHHSETLRRIKGWLAVVVLNDVAVWMKLF
ncbi:MAG: hypothetical protein R2804_11350 [Cyclobacteriaceae bacterium]